MKTASTKPSPRDAKTWSCWHLLRAGAIVVVTGALLWSLLDGNRLNDIGWETLAAGAMALPASVLSMVFLAARLRCLTENRVSFIHSVKACSLAVTAAYLSPSRLSDGIKPLYLKAQAKLPLVQGFAAVLLERMTDVLWMVIILGFFMALAELTSGLREALIGVALPCAAAVAGLIIAAKFPGVFDSLVARIPFIAVRRLAERLLSALRRAAKPNHLAAAMVFGGLTWATSFAIYWSYFAFSPQPTLEFDAVVAVFLLSTLGLVLSVLPAGIGTFEGAFYIVLAQYGYSLGDSILAAFILRLTIILPPFAVSLWTLGTDRITLQKIADAAGDDEPDGGERRA